MKRILILLLFLVVLTGCKSIKSSNQNIEVDKQIISTFLDNWHQAASEANFENYFGAMDSISVFVGTDAKEVWNKNEFKKFSKPYFDKGKAWSFTAVDRNIYVHNSGKIVWFDELLDTWMGICRGSGVIEKIDADWKIKHYVLSVAVPNEDIKPIIAIKKERDSLFLKDLKSN